MCSGVQSALSVEGNGGHVPCSELAPQPRPFPSTSLGTGPIPLMSFHSLLYSFCN